MISLPKRNINAAAKQAKPKTIIEHLLMPSRILSKRRAPKFCAVKTEIAKPKEIIGCTASCSTRMAVVKPAMVFAPNLLQRDCIKIMLKPKTENCTAMGKPIRKCSHISSLVRQISLVPKCNWGKRW